MVHVIKLINKNIYDLHFTKQYYVRFPLEILTRGMYQYQQ